jgi:uncharacterized membrane protein
VSPLQQLLSGELDPTRVAGVIIVVGITAFFAFLGYYLAERSRG